MLEESGVPAAGRKILRRDSKPVRLERIGGIGTTLPAAVVLVILWLCLNASLLRPFSFDHDSANYTLGMAEFRVDLHQPHPPGYLLWIVAARAMAKLTADDRVGQSLLALLFTAGSLAFFYLLVNRMLGAWGALTLTCLLAFSPTVLLYSCLQTTYVVDLFASCALGWLAARVLIGEFRLLPLLYAAAAALMGFRPSGIVLLFPLLLLPAIRALKARAYRHLAFGLVVAMGVVCAWFFPLTASTGGLVRWRAMNQVLVMEGVRSTSVFFGAPLDVHRTMIRDLFLHLGLELLPIALCVAIAGLLARKTCPTTLREAAAQWDRGYVYVTWIAPCLLADAALHYPKPGYTLLVVPPLFLALGRWVGRRLRNRFGDSEPDTEKVWFYMLAVGLPLSLAVSYFPYASVLKQHWNPLTEAALKATPRWAHQIADGYEQLRDATGREHGGPQDKLLFLLRVSTEAPNARTVSVDFPRTPTAFIRDNRPIMIVANESRPLNVPARVKSIYWVSWINYFPDDISRAFPLTFEILQNDLFALWRSDLPLGPFEETVQVGSVAIPIRRRPVERRIVAPANCLPTGAVPPLVRARGESTSVLFSSRDSVWAWPFDRSPRAESVIVRVRYRMPKAGLVKLGLYTNSPQLFVSIPSSVALDPRREAMEVSLPCDLKPSSAFGPGQWAVIGLQADRAGTELDVLGVEVDWFE
jgi:hypothetical protein